MVSVDVRPQVKGVGIVWVSSAWVRICMGQDHMYGETPYVLFACSVSFPL